MECLFTQITELGSARGWLAAHEPAAVRMPTSHIRKVSN
jgi:hypothetical protein